MKRNLLWLPALAVAAALVAAGCGGGGSDSSTSSLTKTEWIAKADSICQQSNQAINQAAHQQFGNQRPTAPEVQQFVTQTVLPETQGQVDKLKALEAPSGDEDQVNKILGEVQADLDKSKSTGVVDNSTFADANALAKQYGLKVCGQG
jgi:hypothetical protein